MPNRSGATGRLLVGLAIAAFAIFSFLASREYNPVVGETQYIGLTQEQEIALGYNSIPQMLEEMGQPANDPQLQTFLDQIGNELVSQSIAADTPWEWQFTVLQNDDLVNAFALPGGPTFITTAMLNEMTNENQVAAVMAHEIVHVLARHGAQRVAQQQLTEGLLQGVAIATNPETAQGAATIAQLVGIRYSREDESQSDSIGVDIMVDAGYDPCGMAELMQILESQQGGQAPPEFLSTHPSPGSRIQAILQKIEADYPEYAPCDL